MRFDGVPAEVKPVPLLSEHTAEVLEDRLGYDADAVVRECNLLLTLPPGPART